MRNCIRKLYLQFFLYRLFATCRSEMEIIMEKELVIVLDFGGQYNQLIARRVRECNVYCEVHPNTLELEKIREMNPKGIIFTGGPNSAYLPDSPSISKEIFELGVPILGICYGSQLIAHLLGGEVATAPTSEYGKTEVTTSQDSVLFGDVSHETICWMSHTDYIAKAPEGFVVSGGGYGKSRAEIVRHPVPPGGHAHRRGHENALQFRV